ncbi:glycosyltransferase family 2 protein [Phaeobacter sp. PT47_59]|uniref:glycosyltransferase family 2 protein n=1 Tax=Phaeobacter sp. PT47_59 TaxID=3029979 RepID=UPI00237FDA01|nr:glycosyltransferase family 2 protein [Phaeobacter sp. PT47_59]MDE4174080.1 glycosyltransferase family 2 protein [Phaeobacter sp. PT47_59]
MRIHLHIGLEHVGADRLQKVLAHKRDQLRGKGVLFPTAPGGSNHTRLFMAATDPDHVDLLRLARGFGDAEKQELLQEKLVEDLSREVAEARPDSLILSASQLGTRLSRRSELARLRNMLLPLSDDIRIVAHLDDPARLLARTYGAQVLNGRAAPLPRDLDLVQAPDWWLACQGTRPEIDPQAGIFEETEGAPFWLDFTGLQARWEAVFGAGSLSFRSYDADRIYGPEATEELRAMFEIAPRIGRAKPGKLAPVPSAAWITRARQLNALLQRLILQMGSKVPLKMRQAFLNEIHIGGDPITPESLGAIRSRFAEANTSLVDQHADLRAESFPGAAAVSSEWQEADPQMGYRASQYLASFLPQIEALGKAGPPAQAPAKAASPSDSAKKLMSPLALKNFEMLQGSPFQPHNRIGALDETAQHAPYSEAPRRPLPEGSSGTVIVGCMKNEAPYIVEWVAYHRAIGVDNFLIYTNGCEDGTAEILDRLQEMGVLQHRNNDDWRGNSPQQFALNRALKEPVIQNAEWIIHIDVDEFINVRCGNGTLQDFLDRVPEATNVAMTWRLFGHNGVTGLNDDFVIGQFDACAPKYCPKPHTVWGFKTMFKNTGAYQKFSCHRPNKLQEGKRDQVAWVNGSGRDMTREAIDNGWRSSRGSVGYDLLQLNHYALRSAESFLVKRQRGRALHVDRSIGLNYWIRMDWNDHKDTTIQRNLPRLKAEYDRLMADETLSDWHEKGLEWHRAKAAELHGMEEFETLYRQALEVKLSATERVAYALALDMES